MDYILAFIAGVVFFAILLPIANNIIDVLEALKNLFISKINVKANENNIAIQLAANEVEQSNIAAIGFQYNDPESELDNFLEEDKSKGRKIGF